jgi:hypothetical protein
MRFFGEFVGATINVEAYKKSVDDFLGEKLEEGARVWLTAVTGRVPLWSGMARASLLELSRLANGKILLSPLKDKSRIPAGESLGSARMLTDFPSYIFEVATQVPHYTLQEFTNVRNATGRGSPSAPWRSFDAGQEAFFEYARSVRLPPLVFEKVTVRKL